ncbi:hypothetical protein P7C70_g5084, partial [Phenoliferia sp. Uapishka_3]
MVASERLASPPLTRALPPLFDDPAGAIHPTTPAQQSLREHRSQLAGNMPSSVEVLGHIPPPLSSVNNRLASLEHLRSLGPLIPTLRNQKAWFIAMEHTLESYGVLPFLKARLEDEPVLLADSSNRDAVLAYQTGRTLACHLLQQNCGPFAQHYLINGNLRASWRRLGKSFRHAEGDWDAGLERLRYWMACRFNEGDDLGAWVRKMASLRNQVSSLRWDDDYPQLSDGFSRDILLANLPPEIRNQLDLQRRETSLAEVVLQLEGLAVVLAEEAAVAAHDVTTNINHSEGAVDRATSPTSSVNSADVEVGIYYRNLYNKFPSLHALELDRALEVEARTTLSFPILRLPLELISLILHHTITPPILITSTHASTLRMALNSQERRASLRLVCTQFSQALGSPTDLAIRNLTKLRAYLAVLSLHPEQGRRVQNVVLRLRDSKSTRCKTVELGDKLCNLFQACPRIKTLHALGVQALENEDGNEVESSKPTRNDVLLNAIATNLDLTEFSYLGGYAHLNEDFMKTQPNLTHVSMSRFCANPDDPGAISKLEPTILDLAIGSREERGITGIRALARLDLTGALQNLRNLTIFDLTVEEDGENVEKFIETLSLIAPRLKTFTFTSTRDFAAPPRTFDRLFPLFTSATTLTIPFECYTSMSFISSLPPSIKTITLLGPDIVRKWGDHLLALGNQLHLIDACGVDGVLRKLTVVLCIQDRSHTGTRRLRMFHSQLTELLGPVPPHMYDGDGWKGRLLLAIQAYDWIKIPVWASIDG